MLRQIMTMFFGLMMLFSISCFANQEAGCSIANIDGNKAYLKPGSVHVAKNGIFINLAGELVAINHLDMDEQGVYFDLDKTAVEWIRTICPYCNRYFEGTSYKCPHCGKR